MKFSDAKKLHKGDEVMVKNIGEIATVLSIKIVDKSIEIDIAFSNGLGTTVLHKEIS